MLLAPLVEHLFNATNIKRTLNSIDLVLELFIKFSFTDHNYLVLTQILFGFIDVYHEID